MGAIDGVVEAVGVIASEVEPNAAGATVGSGDANGAVGEKRNGISSFDIRIESPLGAESLIGPSGISADAVFTPSGCHAAVIGAEAGAACDCGG